MLIVLSLLAACTSDSNDTDTDIGTDTDSGTDTAQQTSLDAIDFTGNVTLTDRVSDPDLPDYTLNSEVTIEGTLTIESGVRIDIAPSGGLLVTPGTLVTRGTEDAPVILDGGIGITLRGAGNELVWTQVRNAGQDVSLLNNEAAAITLGLDNLAATATFTNVTVADSAGVGLFLDTASTLTAQGLVLDAPSGEYAVVTDYEQLGMFGADVQMTDAGNPTVRSRSFDVMTEATTIDLPTAPVVLADDLIVDTSASLTLQAGTELRFPAGGGLYASGPVVSNGTEDAPVVLTGPQATPGSWVGVRLEASSGNQMTWTTISYGGGDMAFSDDANLVIGNDLTPSTVALSNVTLSNSAAWGVVFYNLSAVVDLGSVTFAGNASGESTGDL